MRGLGFVLGGWWATHVARQKAEAGAARPRLRHSNPHVRTQPQAPLQAYDTVASQN